MSRHLLLRSSRGPRSQGAFTLPELLVVLVVLAVAFGLALPVAGSMLDRWAVRSARDQALALLHRTRMEARLSGGARLELASDPVELRITVDDSLVTRWRGAGGVTLDLPGGRGEDVLRFDALGLGIVTSRTLRFRRGRAESRLVVSSRGRGRRD